MKSIFIFIDMETGIIFQKSFNNLNPAFICFDELAFLKLKSCF
jgi:hypothetical protein